MQKISNSEILPLLQSGEILMTLTAGQPQYHALVQQRVRIQTSNSRYTLSMEDWQRLFEEEKFWLYEPEDTAEISGDKDEEYYRWNHK